MKCSPDTGKVKGLNYKKDRPGQVINKEVWQSQVYCSGLEIRRAVIDRSLGSNPSTSANPKFA